MSDSIDNQSGRSSLDDNFSSTVEQEDSDSQEALLDSDADRTDSAADADTSQVLAQQGDTPFPNASSTSEPLALEASGQGPTSPGRLAYHPLANTFPLMIGEEYDAFYEDIKLNGQREPIIVYEGKILDGRNRYRALIEQGREPETIEYEGDTPLEFVLSMNMYRRQLTVAQRSMIAADIMKRRTVTASSDEADADGHEADGADGAGKVGLTSSQASTLLGISERSVSSAGRIARTGTDELRDAVLTGKVKISVAEYIAKLDEEEQRELCAAGPAEMRKKARDMREARKRKDDEPEQLESFTGVEDEFSETVQEPASQSFMTMNEPVTISDTLLDFQAMQESQVETVAPSAGVNHSGVAVFLAQVARTGHSHPEEVADQIWRGISALGLSSDDQAKALEFTAQVAAAIHSRMIQSAIIETASMEQA